MFGRKKKSTQAAESDHTCPYCKHHCTEDHLRCDKGKEYFNIPLGSTKSAGSGSHTHHSHHSSQHHTSQHHTSSVLPNYSQEELDTLKMTPNEHTYALFCKCRYIFREVEKYGSVDPDILFGFLTEQERDTLNLLLRKCIRTWESPVQEADT